MFLENNKKFPNFLQSCFEVVIEYVSMVLSEDWEWKNCVTKSNCNRKKIFKKM